MRVFIVKQVKNDRIPAGELELAGNVTKLHYNDYTLFRIVKALFSRSLCSREKDGEATHKPLSSCKFKEILRFIKRPFYFSDVKTVPWRYTETFANV